MRSHASINDIRRLRDPVIRRLNDVPRSARGISQGAIYAFSDVSAIGLLAEDAVDPALDETGVVVETTGFYGAVGRALSVGEFRILAIKP